MYEHLACTLFNLDDSHSFISTMFAHLSKLATKPLSESLNVTLLMGDMVVCSKVVLGNPLVLCRHVLETNLIVFNLLGFDIILGMGWLSRHYACINYHSRTFSF